MTILNDINDKDTITIFSIDLNKNLNSEFYQKIKQSWIEQFPHNRIIIYDRDDEEVRECLDSEYCKKLLSWNCLNYACNLPRANILSKHDKYLYMDLDVWVYDGSFIEDLNENTWFESYFNNRPANIYCLAYSGIGHS